MKVKEESEKAGLKLNIQKQRSQANLKNTKHFSYGPLDVGNLISGSSAFSKSSLYI